jgi:hypothetical protein
MIDYETINETTIIKRMCQLMQRSPWGRFELSKLTKRPKIARNVLYF